MSRQSRLSANDKGDNEVKIGIVHRFPGIYYLTAEESPGKLQLGDSLMKTVGPAIASNGIPYLQMTSVGSERNGSKGRKDHHR